MPRKGKSKYSPDEGKKKITISIDTELLNTIDRQRGNTKRSTYINEIIDRHFMPTVPEEEGGGTFVTTLELRKTLKNVHDKMKLLELLQFQINDLEKIVYSHVYHATDKGEKKEGAVKSANVPSTPSVIITDVPMELTPQISSWINTTIKKHGNIQIRRDFDSYTKLDGVEPSKIALAKMLRTFGMEYDEDKHLWKM